MVDNHVVRGVRRDRVDLPATLLSSAPLTRSHSQVAYHHIVRRVWIPPRINVIPGLGAVWPATVKKGSSIEMDRFARSITPPTSNTTIRGPEVVTASRKDPGPLASNVVTRMICPPRPPGVSAAQP